MVNVAAERRKRSWSQVTLAKEAGVHVRTLRRIEKGEAVSDVMTNRVYKALGLPSDLPGIDLEQAIDRLAQNRFWGSGPKMLDMILIAIMVCGIGCIFFGVDRWWETGTACLLICALGASSIGLSIFLGMAVDSYRDSLKAELAPYCLTLVEAIRSGRLRALDSREVRSVSAILGCRILTEARNSRYADLTVVGERA